MSHIFTRFSGNMSLAGFTAWGVVVAVVSTVGLRLFGQHVFITGDSTQSMLLFAITVPLIASVTLPVYRMARIGPTVASRAAICIALPGILFDSFAVRSFHSVYPNMPPGAAALYGSWVLWAYALMLLSGLVPVSYNTCMHRNQ